MSRNSDAGNKPSLLSDEELMAQYQKTGDEKAFEGLYQRHASRVYGYLSRRVPVRAERDELHQAVFLKFHQSRHLYKPRHSVLQWIFVIARTTLFDHLRKLRRSVPVLAEESSGASQIENIAVNEPVEFDLDIAALGKLSEHERSAVQMRVIDELSYHEISKKLGRPEPSIRQIVSRALRKLRLAFEGGGGNAQ